LVPKPATNKSTSNLHGKTRSEDETDSSTDAGLDGGPAAAIEVCSHEAPTFAAAVGKKYGVTIGRTSFKLRNPKNVTPEWVKPLITARREQPEFVSLPHGGTGALLPIKLKRVQSRFADVTTPPEQCEASER
jgi:hypothetical protein